MLDATPRGLMPVDKLQARTRGRSVGVIEKAKFASGSRGKGRLNLRAVPALPLGCSLPGDCNRSDAQLPTSSVDLACLRAPAL